MSYKTYLETTKDLVAMIHLPPLPGSPRNRVGPQVIIEDAIAQAELYKEHGVKTVMIENMHDVPYTRSVGSEISSLMTVIGHEIKRLGLFCGIQILAGCNEAALGAAHSAGLDFVRVEGFVFGHLADEGFFESCAGELLRYRRRIGADKVLLFTDIKKKHSSHALTADVDIVETAKAANFFLSDGIVVTGNSTATEAEPSELEALGDLGIRRVIGSGVTPENIERFFPLADVFIVGSYMKTDGHWANLPDPERVKKMVSAFKALDGTQGGRW